MEWYRCPNCGQKILQVNSKSIATSIFIKCKNCHKVIEIKIQKAIDKDNSIR